MGTSLNGLTPANTYQALIKVGNNTNLNTTLKTLSDGAGNDLPMQASTTAINFTGTVSGLASGVSGAIQFSNGSAFASDASNLFWDDTNNRLGIGTNSPSATAHIVGANSLSSGYAVKVLNSSGGGILSVTNDGYTQIGDFTGQGFGTLLTFLRPAGGTRLTTFNQGNSNLVITNGIGNVTFQNTPVQVVGSGSTSATTSLLVQDSAGTNLMTLRDDGIITLFSSSKTGQLDIQGGTNSGVYARAYNSQSDNIIRYKDYNGNQCMTLTMTGSGAGALVVNSNTNNASAVLQADSTTKGFLPPRMTTTQKNAISTPAAGLQVFDSTMNATCEYTGTAWRVVSAGAQAVTVTGLLQTVSLANGNVLDITLNSSTTFTFTNPTIGTYILKLTQGVGGGFLVTWPVNVIWSGGTAPTLSTTAGKIDIITLIYDGTSYYGNYSLNY